MWDKSTFKDLFTVLSDEADKPHLSGITGHADKAEGRVVKSFYKKMVERNRCNRGDYQNVATNGARSRNAMNNTVRGLRRNPNLDYPLFLTYELIGNDVCSGHPGVDHFTQPEDFKQHVLSQWKYLDTTLPKGSHLLVWGLVDGRVLYD
jgi:acyloxyacyl hydrolase